MTHNPRLLFPLLALTLLASCNFLEEYSQDTDYVHSWKDLDELLIGSCYTPINATTNYTEHANDGMFLHLVGDEMVEFTQGPHQEYDYHEYSFGVYTWQQRSGQNESYTDFFQENQAWTNTYKHINVANNIIESLKDTPNNTDAEQQGHHKVNGEAHFLRAFHYFWLLNIYAKPYDPATAATDPGLPIKTSENVEDVKFQRNSVQEVYDLILSDLHIAEQELTLYKTPKKSIYRADSVAVQLLLSRVYLYMQNWPKAEEYARKVLRVHPELMYLDSSTDFFASTFNPENIFSMGGDDLALMMLNGVKSYTISSELYSAYGQNDLRRSRWFWARDRFVGLTKRKDRREMGDPVRNEESIDFYFYGYNYFMPGEYAEVSSLFWLRSAEAYLTLSEALAYQGRDNESLEVLNRFRQARYNNGINVNLSGTELVSQIRKERRLEFVLEGHRWFDLRRYRVCAVQPEKISIVHDYTYYEERTSTRMTGRHRFTLTEDDPSWTMPIPYEVISYNTGMAGNGNLWREYEEVDYY